MLQKLRNRIKAKAADTVELKGTLVHVDVEDSLVVLSGAVRLYVQKITYEKIAWQTVGVAEVENGIRVTPKFRLDDIAIERKIREIIKTYRRLHGTGLRVIVEDGVMVL